MLGAVSSLAMVRDTADPAHTKDLLDSRSVVYYPFTLTRSLGQKFLCLGLSLSLSIYQVLWVVQCLVMHTGMAGWCSRRDCR
jgi:hypothetical protein